MNGHNNKRKLMVMAAGTGGHIFPGLAIAKMMRQQGWDVCWLGTQAGMENKIVPSENIPFFGLNFSGMRGKGLRHTVQGFFKLIQSFWQCRQILKKEKPDVVLGMGGYVTVPGGVMSKLMGHPLVLMNADAALLLSNKMLRPIADRLLFGLPSAETSDVFVTGNPVRQEILAIAQPRSRYTERAGALRILVVGGSLGAKVLNETLPKAIALLAPEERPIVTHQSGAQHIDGLKKAYAELQITAHCTDFIHDMASAFAEADLIICRAGAITVSEMTAVGVASVLVPFMASSTSHQLDNARWMEKEGAAICVTQAELSAQRIAHIIRTTNRETCLLMAEKAYQLGKRQANQTIASILEELA